MKKYKTIVIDPPWRYSNAHVSGAAENHYPTMSDEEIMSLSIPADNDAVLLCWATFPKLITALQCISGWGFKYKTGFPWIKIQKNPEYDLWGNLEIIPCYGNGFWIRGTSEVVLIAIKGNVRYPKTGFIGLLCKRMRHSKKPDSLYEYAETSFEPPYLEMFARQQHPGWDVFGNEIENSIQIPLKNT